MVSTTHEKDVVLLQPGSYAKTPDQPGEDDSFILLVEDDVPTLRLERVILEEAGYEVRVVGSGEEALQSLSKETPSLVMLDIGLPGMDGFTTCERIRESSEVPVLMVSGRDSDDDKARGLSAGATDYLTKPFATHGLAELVNKLLLLFQASLGADHTSDPLGQVRELTSPATVRDEPSHDFTPPTPSVAAESEQGPIPSGEFGKVGKVPGHTAVGEDSVHTLAPGAEPAEPVDPREPNEGFYEGTVRLMVTTPGKVSGLLAFVGELRQNPGFRLLRLVANQSREGMDIWLGLREPLLLRTVLLKIEGVSQVTAPAEPNSNDSELGLIVLLGAE